MDRYLLASYDYTKAKGYILSAGDYYFTIGDNAHDALNNVLAAENATGMTDFDGKPVEGDAAKTYRWSYDDVDTKTYAKSDAGERVTNRFEDADANYWKDGAVTYLTRSDWKGTFPTEPVKMTATGKMIELLKGDLYRQSKDSKSVSDYTQGADNGLTFVMMKDVDYNDDETWNKYLDEMTIDEMTTQLSDLFGTAEAASVNRPAYAAGDGTASVGGNTYAKEYGDARDVTLYPATNVLASTWDYGRMQRRGELVGGKPCMPRPRSDGVVAAICTALRSAGAMANTGPKTASWSTLTTSWNFQLLRRKASHRVSSMLQAMIRSCIAKV